MNSIGYVSPYFEPANKAAAVRAVGFVDELEKKWDVTVFTSLTNEKYNVISCRTSLPTNKDKYIVRILKELTFGAEQLFRILFNDKKDIYIVTSPHFFAAALASLAIKMKGARLKILDVRDIYPEILFQFNLVPRNSLLGKCLLLLEKQMYAQYDFIVTATHGLKKRVVAVCDKEVCVIKNGFDDRIFAESLTKYPHFTLVFHGTMGALQNVELLVELIQYCELERPHLRFLVIGNGPKDYLLRGMSCKNLTYKKDVPYSSIPLLISQAHVGISFRTDDEVSIDSLPVKIFEYIGVGIPTISTPITEAGEMLFQDSIGVQCANDLSAILSSIDSVMDSYDLCVDNIRKSKWKFTRQYQGELLIRAVNTYSVVNL